MCREDVMTGQSMEALCQSPLPAPIPYNWPYASVGEQNLPPQNISWHADYSELKTVKAQKT